MPNKKSLYRAMEILPLLLVVVLVFSAICLANSKELILRYDGQEKGHYPRSSKTPVPFWKNRASKWARKTAS